MKNLPLMYFDANPPKLRCKSANKFFRFLLRRCGLLDFVEDNAGRLLNAEEAYNGSHASQHGQQRPVRSGEVEDVMVLHSLGGVALDLLLLLLLMLRLLLLSAVGCWRPRLGTRLGSLRLGLLA